MSTINKKLLPLKLLFFFLYGALGCLVAFITNHMFELGLTHEEVTLINGILPLTALAGPPAIGYLADRFGHYRLITIVSMLLTGLFHTSLLFVPKREMGLQPPFHLLCGPSGAAMVLYSCTNQCPRLDGIQEGSFRISGCRQECDVSFNSCTDLAIDNENKSIIIESEVSTSLLEEPLVCLHSKDGTSQCNTFHFNTFIDVSREFNSSSFQRNLYPHLDECCEYPISSYSTNSQSFTSMTCETSTNCHIICNIQELTNGSGTFQKPECSLGGSNPHTTFWLYFCLRAIADMLVAVMIALLDAVILTMIAQHGGDYGRQKMFGLFAIGIAAPIVGYLMDNGVVLGNYIYAPVFYTFDIMMLFTALITFTLPFQVDVQRTSLLKNLYKLVHTAELNLLFLIVILLGTFWGFLETFLPPHMLKNLNSTNLLIGLTVSAGVLPSIPFLYKSDGIVRICGHHYLLMLAFVGYCIRFAGLSHVTDPHWIILLEVFKVASLNIMQVASATLAYKLAPKTLVATAQGIVWMAHFNIGRTIGTIVGGYLIESYSIIWVFSGASVLSAICATIYLTSYQVINYLREKESRKKQGALPKRNGNLPNGNYVPLSTQEKY